MWLMVSRVRGVCEPGCIVSHRLTEKRGKPANFTPSLRVVIWSRLLSACEYSKPSRRTCHWRELWRLVAGRKCVWQNVSEPQAKCLIDAQVCIRTIVTYIQTCMHKCNRYKHACIHTSMRAYMHTCLLTDVVTYLPGYLLTYTRALLTDIHTHTHARRRVHAHVHACTHAPSQTQTLTPIT